MSIITLTSDLGTKDYYVAAIKGAILSQYPEASIVDISHDIPRFDIMQAAFVLKNVMHDFPAGTVHIIGVLPNATAQSPHVAIKYNNQYFIGADNGIFTLLFDKQAESIVELTISQETDLLTFPTKDIFVKAACHLARGGTLGIIGGTRDAILQRTMFRAVVDDNTIKGSAIYIDVYGNVITNINRQLFREVGRGRDFIISFRVPGYDITKISNTYNDVVQSERLALFGHTGNLEIAINIGHASNLLGLKMNDIIRIEFRD